jgi:hypothetical protein
MRHGVPFKNKLTFMPAQLIDKLLALVCLTLVDR